MLTTVVTFVFEEDGKFYPQIFLDECLHKLLMLKYDKIDITDGIDINKANESKECDICHYWYFLSTNFSYEPYLWNGCHNWMQKVMNYNDVAIVSVKGSDYRIHFLVSEQNDALNIMNNSDVSKKSRFFSLCIKNEWNNLLSKKQRCYTK